MTAAESHRVNVIWNNTFRRIFNCCWRESTSGLQFYCNSLPMNFIIDQHAILFYRRIMNSSNTILHALLCIKQCRTVVFTCKIQYFVPLVITAADTRSSADADNGLDAFSCQSRSTNTVPFWVHCDFSLSM